VDGFAVSRLAPYTSWGDVFAEFIAHWSRYADQVKPDKVTQLAVRYINRFDFPGNRVELRDYFRTYPEVSADIKYNISGFLNQLQIPMPDIGGQAVITQALAPPPVENIMSVLLDIAVSSLFDATLDNQEIEKAMQILRTKKNEFKKLTRKSFVLALEAPVTKANGSISSLAVSGRR